MKRSTGGVGTVDTAHIKHRHTLFSAGDCSGHGTMSSTGLCKCDAGWTGSACDTVRCPSDCHEHGVCMLGVCVCDEYHLGADCGTKRCLNDCSNNGYCFEGTCQCSNGFGGSDCSRTK